MSTLIHLLYPQLNGVELPDSVKEYLPYLYEEGNDWCCLLGSDPQIGIFGCGSTAMEALQSWDRAFQFLIRLDPFLKSIWSHARERNMPNYWLWYKLHFS